MVPSRCHPVYLCLSIILVCGEDQCASSLRSTLYGVSQSVCEERCDSKCDFCAQSEINHTSLSGNTCQSNVCFRGHITGVRVSYRLGVTLHTQKYFDTRVAEDPVLLCFYCLDCSNLARLMERFLNPLDIWTCLILDLKIQ